MASGGLHWYDALNWARDIRDIVSDKIMEEPMLRTCVVSLKRYPNGDRSL